ncbi:MAG: flippase-like domain-containing protein [Muribaculaceae bacterium]|nr:flippase-like domain-containing protein [Muribaculaceae bacterium]
MKMTDTEKKKTPWLGALLKFVVPVVISCGLCWLLFKDFDLREMWTVIRTQCDFRWIAAALTLSVFSYIFRAMRWRIQLRALGIDPPLFALTLSIFGTYAVNLVFPRLGEVWRTGYIARRQNASFTSVFGSMVADRLADTVTVALITLFTFLVASRQLIQYLSQNQETCQRIEHLIFSPWIWGAAVLMAAGLLYFLRHKWKNQFACKVQKAIYELWQGFAAIFRMPGKGRWLLLTAAIWGCFFMQLVLGFLAFGFTADIIAQYGITAALVTFVLSSISMAVPSNGGIGPWQWAVMFSLGIYGLDTGRAGAFANLILGSNTLMLIALGLFTFACIALERRNHKTEINTHHL